MIAPKKPTNTFVGVIPARGGSKGIPLKNIKLMNGKPLIAYTIESALASGALNRIIVSTDDDRIAAASAQYPNVDVVIRPAELSTDTATTECALIHVCDELLRKENFDVDYVLTLEPTSPLRTKATIQKCVDILKQPQVDSVVGVTETSSVIGRILDDKFVHIFPGQPRRRQDREVLYKESSTIYGTSVAVLRRLNSVLGDCPYPLIIPKQESLDINDALDFQIVESLMHFGDI